MLVKKSLIIQEVVTLLNVETPQERLAACKAAVAKFNSVSHKVQLGINRCVEYKNSGIGVYKVYGFVDFCTTGPCEARWVDTNTFIIYYVDYACDLKVALWLSSFLQSNKPFAIKRNKNKCIMVQHVTIRKWNNIVYMKCQIDGHPMTIMNREMMLYIMSGEPIKVTQKSWSPT